MITETNLSTRLAVPRSQDELQQLSETLNQTLERIEQSFMRTRQFTADASHELRAPMTLIYTAAQYALRRPRSREQMIESQNKILRESQRTITLIDDLLALPRGDAGRHPTDLGVPQRASSCAMPRSRRRRWVTRRTCRSPWRWNLASC